MEIGGLHIIRDLKLAGAGPILQILSMSHGGHGEAATNKKQHAAHLVVTITSNQCAMCMMQYF